MIELHPDVRDLVADLETAGVKFTVRGEALDTIVALSNVPGNLEKLAQALEAFGSPKEIVEAARRLKRPLVLTDDDIVYLGDPPVRLTFELEDAL